MPSFHLDEEAWIPVVWRDGCQNEVSLLTALDRATEIERLAGTPPEVAVLSRLLLAIAHSVRNPKQMADWEDVWNDVPRLLSDMATYVRAHHNSFDLYDVERPFCQHPELPRPSGPTTLIGYDQAGGNNALFFDHNQDINPRRIPSGQAARGLLVIHAFGGSYPGGNHPITKKDEGHLGAGPLAGKVIALLEGECLAKTIALNLVHGRKSGRAAWERNLRLSPGFVASEGLADRYTRESRFARLQPDDSGDYCIAARLSVGLEITKDKKIDDPEDPLIPRFLSRGEIKPWKLSEDRAAWRSADTLLVAHLADDKKEHAPPLRALEQLRALAGEGLFADEERIGMRIVGVLADAQGPKNTLWRDVALRFDLSVVTSDARYEALRSAVHLAEKERGALQRRLARFARNYLGIKEDDRSTRNTDVDDSVSEASTIKGYGSDKKQAETIRSFVGNLVECRKVKLGSETVTLPIYSYFWSEVGPKGEGIALDDFDAEDWRKTLERASKATFDKAVERLPADARRYRAQFAREEKTGEAKPKAGKNT